MSFFKILSTKEVFRLKNYSIKEDEFEIAPGKNSKHLTLVHPGAVVILPQLSANTFLFIKQYRHSLQKTILELPAGTLGVGEDPLLCAQRELIEETNYQASEWISLGTLYPAPGFCDEVQHLFLARGLTPHQGVKDEDEVIEVVNLSGNDLLGALKNNELQDGKSLACILRAQLFDFIKVI